MLNTPEAADCAETARPEATYIAHTLNRASRLSDLSPRTLRREIAEGRLKSFKVRGRRMVTHGDLVALINERSKA